MINNKLIPKRRFKEFENEEAWEQCKLGDLADIVRGASPRPIQDLKWFDENSDVGWLRIADVTEQDGRIYHLEQHISELGQEKTRVLTEPHLLLSIAATVGKPVVNFVNTGVHDGFLIFLKPKFDREFMFQWLEMFRPMWQKYGQPGSQVNLNSDLVKNQKILLPTYEEQEKIGSFFNNLDNLITLLQRKLKKLKELKLAYLSEMFPEEGEKYPKRRFAGFTDPWEQRRLGDRSEILTGGTPKTSIPKYWEPKEISWMSSGEVNKKRIDETDNMISKEGLNNSSARWVKKYSVLIALAGQGKTRGTVAINNISLTTNQSIAAIVPDETLHYEFIYQNLIKRYDELRRISSGDGTRGGLNKQIVSDVIVPYPRYEEQVKIGDFFSQLDQLIILHRRKLEKLENIKKAYLNEMFV